MTPVESVAKAIYLDRNGEGGTPWGRLPEAHKAPYISDAKAAITAIAENVTPAMTNDFHKQRRIDPDRATTKVCIRAAILSALGD